MKKLSRGVAEKAERRVEDKARRKIVEELFYDFNSNRSRIYRLNFFRGIFFGLGSVIGGTIVVTILVYVMSLFVNIPGLGTIIEALQSSMDQGIR